jgi:Ni,Fe-hydrogenase maturation factor
MARPKWLVLGLGNRLVGEDGFGSAVIEMLRGRPDLPAAVDLVDAHTDLLAQVETLASYDEVVLVDVVVGGPGPPKPDVARRVGSGEGGPGPPKPDVARRVGSGEGGGHAGEIAVVDEETFMRWPETSPSCHQISPLLAVKLFRALHPEAATRITLVALHADELRAAPDVEASVVAAGGEAVLRLIR